LTLYKTNCCCWSFQSFRFRIEGIVMSEEEHFILETSVNEGVYTSRALYTFQDGTYVCTTMSWVESGHHRQGPINTHRV
jgi:hypothetical protein